jgi:hypothetical protein
VKMKKLLATLTLSAVAAVTYGQGSMSGTVNIGTAAGANTKFITTDAGTRIAGTDYWIQLFYAPGTVTDESQLIAVTPAVNPRTGAAAGVLASGAYTLQNLDANGGIATLQLRGWSAALGSTYEQAFAAWNAAGPSSDRVLGRSALFQVDTADPTVSPPETPVSIAAMFPGLTLNIVPEPSTYALGLLGLGLVALYRRRK